MRRKDDMGMSRNPGLGIFLGPARGSRVSYPAFCVQDAATSSDKYICTQTVHSMAPSVGHTIHFLYLL